MKKLLNSITAVILFLLPAVGFGQTAATLGTAANFVLFTTVGAVTNTGPSHLTGNVGTNSGSSTGFGNVNGQMHDNDGTTATCSADLLTAYNQLNDEVPMYFPASLLGNGDTLVTGVYKIAGVTTLNGTLVLDAQGNPNAVFIFQIQAAFSSNANAKVKLINGALACNVFWKVEGLVSLAAGTAMRGTIVAHNAAIAMSVNDTLEGRALSISGAVTLNTLMAYTPIGCGSAVLTGPAAPALASTACYGIFSGDGPVTNSGSSYVTGDIGTNVGLTTGFNPLFVAGAIHPIPDGSTAACAADLLNVYHYMDILPADIELLYPAQFGNDLVLTPHTYVMNGAATFTGNLYLDGAGDADAVFAIQINGALSTATFSRVILMNGTQAKNVFWKVEGAVHINDNSLFIGTIICNNGAVNLGTGDSILGRTLTTNGAFTTAAMALTITSGCTTSCSVAPLSGANQGCIGSSYTITDSTTGGTWSSSNTAFATVGSATGVVTGIAAGTAVITYKLLTGCTVMDTFTVNAQPAAISGTLRACIGGTTALADTSTGGTWSSGNTARATIGTASGIVSGISSGTAVITYSTGAGCLATRTVTVSAPPAAISGVLAICRGAATALTDASTGGTWASSNTAVAAIGSATGFLTGVSAGTATITYLVAGGCASTITATVNAIAAITGPSNVCTGQTITLADATTGGVWTSGNTTIATAGSATGIVSGIAGGTTNITYTIPATGCRATAAMTVNNIGAISGTATVCQGLTTSFSDGTTGGTWSSSDAGIATVGSASGLITGVSAGTAIITYSVGTGCTGTKAVTVNPIAAISGPAGVCIGQTITLADAATGGIWSSSNAAIGRVGSLTGIVTGVASGNVNISYNVGGCRSVQLVSVGGIGAIAGPTAVCTGQTITLTDAVGGGTWSSNATGVATVGSMSGIVSGIASGSSVITYVVGTGGCMVTTTISVSLLSAIAGPVSVCVGQAVTLTDATTGGVWNTNNTTIATIGSSTGIVSGVRGGFVTISYTISGCRATAPMTVNRLSPISGPASVCQGQVATLNNPDAGGTWSSSDITTATVGSSTGVVAGIAAGTAIMSCTLPSGCTATRTQTVNPFSDITGATTLCTTATTTLADATTGGAWTSGNATIASVGSATGIVTGMRSGATTITYTIAATGCKTSAHIAVSNCREANETATQEGAGNDVALTIFPDPNNGSFTLSGSFAATAGEEVDIRVTDMLGRVVYSNKIMVQNGSISEKMQLANTLTNGMYLIAITTPAETKVLRFVVKN